MGKSWTEEEVELLEESLPTPDLYALSEQFDRTVCSVRSKLQMLRAGRRIIAKEFAVYKGEELLVIGTAEQCAAELKINPDSIRWYSTPTAQKRHAKRKNPEKAVTAIKL